MLVDFAAIERFEKLRAPKWKAKVFQRAIREFIELNYDLRNNLDVFL